MEEALIAVLKAGEIVVDGVGAVYERVFADDSSENAAEQSTDDPE